MTLKHTIELAREAGAIHIHKSPKEFALVGNDTIKAFEALVRADEREACADVAESTPWSDWFRTDCAAAIRARGRHDT